MWRNKTGATSDINDLLAEENLYWIYLKGFLFYMLRLLRIFYTLNDNLILFVLHDTNNHRSARKKITGKLPPDVIGRGQNH